MFKYYRVCVRYAQGKDEKLVDHKEYATDAEDAAKRIGEILARNTHIIFAIGNGNRLLLKTEDVMSVLVMGAIDAD